MAIPAADLSKMGGAPQTARLYMVVQQAERHTGAAWTDYDWSGTVTANVGAADPVISLSVNSNNAIQLYDGMTVFISHTAYGEWELGICRLHGDQNIGAGAETLYIAVESTLRPVVIGDFVVVLNEFRFWARYPYVTNGAGLTFYKDYGYFRDSLGANGYTWAQLGASDALRTEAMMPPTPVMSSHAVKFLPSGTPNVTVTWDWSNSYVNAPGAALVWGGANNSWGEIDHVGGTWASNAANPGAQTYATISGLRGFRTWVELDTNVTDPIVEYRRGVRYTFILRRPGDTQPGDPVNSEPFTNFKLNSCRGDFESGMWRASITMWEAQKEDVLPGALVILFTDDAYGGTAGSVGPYSDREEILLIGRVVDNSIDHNSETGETTFDIVSIGEQAGKRENYSVPIDDDPAPDDWYKTDTLTVERAAWFFCAWHTTFPLIADVRVDTLTLNYPIRGQEFLAGDMYQGVLDSFIKARYEGHVAFNRFEMMYFERDACAWPGTAPLLFTLANTHWLETARLREVQETACSLVEAGGVAWDAATMTATPYLSAAPGAFSRYLGRPMSSNAYALPVAGSQGILNTLSGDILARRNNPYPSLQLRMAGNWRWGDIVPQEHVVVTMDLLKANFTAQNFILRGVSYEHNPEAGALFATFDMEQETDGYDGVTVTIDAEIPVAGPMLVVTPPAPPPVEYRYTGHIIGAESVGVWYCDDYDLEMGAAPLGPVWLDLDNATLAAWAAGNLHINDMRTHWWNGQESLFTATSCSICEYAPLPPGSGQWYQRYHRDDILALAGAELTEIGMYHLCFSPENPGWGWVAIRSRGSPVNRTSYCVVAHTRDGFKTLEWSRIVAQYTANNSQCQQPSICVDPCSNGLVVYVCFHFGAGDGTSYLYKSSDAGSSWTLVSSDVTAGVSEGGNTVWVSEADHNYVYWYTCKHLKRSVNAGASFVDLFAHAQAHHSRILIPPESVHVAYWQDYRRLKYWEEGDVAWTNFGAEFDPANRELWGFDIDTRNATTLLPTSNYYVGDNWAAGTANIKFNDGVCQTCNGDWIAKSGDDPVLSVAFRENGLNRTGY